MTDHQTHSQNPDDAGKPPNDDWSDSYLAAQWAKIWDDLRPSVRPAWLGPKPAGPTAHYWVNADGSAVRTAVDTGDAGFRAGDVVRVVNGRIARSLPDQVGPGHDDPRAGIVSTVPPNTGPPPSITWADVMAMLARLPAGPPPGTDWHWQPIPGGGWYSGPPDPAITTEPCQCPACQSPETLCAACLAPATPGHACDAVKRARAAWEARVVPSVPFFDQVREVRALVDEINTPAGLDGEPTLADAEGNLWHLDDEALHPLYRTENLDGPSLPLSVVAGMVGPMAVPPTTGEQP